MTRATGVTRSTLPSAAVVTEAKLRGASVGVAESADRRVAVLAHIGRALRFPAYYGRNLDALEECLGDLSWLPEGEVVLVWDGEDELRRADPAGHAALMEVLAAAAEQRAGSPRPLHVVLPTRS